MDFRAGSFCIQSLRTFETNNGTQPTWLDFRAGEGGFFLLINFSFLEPLLSPWAPSQPYRFSSRLTRAFSINKFFFLATVEHTYGTQSTRLDFRAGRAEFSLFRYSSFRGPSSGENLKREYRSAENLTKRKTRGEQIFKRKILAESI
jgi:hypothetical protein